MASARERVEKVREAIKQMRGDGVAKRFSEEELEGLYKEGYTEPEDLLSISRESLIEMGLRKARVDALICKPAEGNKVQNSVSEQTESLVSLNSMPFSLHNST